MEEEEERKMNTLNIHFLKFKNIIAKVMNDQE
jgi:hypothetical protein